MLKNYTITVNGVAYDVTVEENEGGLAAPMSAPRMEVPKAAPKAAAAPSGAQGSKKITAGAAGKIIKIDVKVGDTIKVGQSVGVIEMMKMENPIVSSHDGVVATVDTKEGAMVEAGQVLVTLN